VKRAEITSLAHAIAEARDLLRAHGDKWTSARMEDLGAALDRGDMTAISSALSEATGSMGSLRDIILSVANGDDIRPDEEEPVNARLDLLVREVERRARAAPRLLILSCSVRVRVRPTADILLRRQPGLPQA
jgi:hypothetical protein